MYLEICKTLIERMKPLRREYYKNLKIFNNMKSSGASKEELINQVSKMEKITEPFNEMAREYKKLTSLKNEINEYKEQIKKDDSDKEKLVEKLNSLLTAYSLLENKLAEKYGLKKDESVNKGNEVKTSDKEKTSKRKKVKARKGILSLSLVFAFLVSLFAPKSIAKGEVKNTELKNEKIKTEFVMDNKTTEEFRPYSSNSTGCESGYCTNPYYVGNTSNCDSGYCFSPFNVGNVTYSSLPVETTKPVDTKKLEEKNKSNKEATSKVVNKKEYPKENKIKLVTEDKKETTVGIKNNKTYSKGENAITTPNGISCVDNGDGNITIYQNVDGKLMQRTTDIEGTIHHSKSEGEFTSEGELNLGYYGVSGDDLHLDGDYENSEGSAVYVRNNGQTVTTIDHSTGSKSVTQFSASVVKGMLEVAKENGIPYYEYTSAKGHLDAGTLLREVNVTFPDGSCGFGFQTSTDGVNWTNLDADGHNLSGATITPKNC